MLVKEIIKIIGADVSTSNSKMPGTSFGLSATACAVGGKLQQIEGSVCSKCYALRLENIRPSVHAGYMKRTEAACKLTDDDFFQKWTAAMVIRIGQKLAKLDSSQQYHRWHDSGDLQSNWHLHAILTIAWQMPDVQFWLPTKEKKLVNKLKPCEVPPNLTIRLSGPMIDGSGIKSTNVYQTSSVHKDLTPYGYICPAPHQGNSCSDCRACWDSNVVNVSYKQH